MSSETQHTTSGVNSTPTLTIKRLFNNFFLLHDFFYKLTKIKATSSQFFDLQYDAANSIIHATRSGGRIGQIVALGGLSIYFLKGNSIKTRFLLGILYGYWVNHFYTLGSYAGILVTLPRVYRMTFNYYAARPQEHNYLEQLAPYMDKDVEDTQTVLTTIFPDEFISKSYIKNDYFQKNWDKYSSISQNDQTLKKPSVKLPYLDCFFTRYIYHSLNRWQTRLQIFLGLKESW